MLISEEDFHIADLPEATTVHAKQTRLTPLQIREIRNSISNYITSVVEKYGHNVTGKTIVRPSVYKYNDNTQDISIRCHFTMVIKDEDVTTGHHNSLAVSLSLDVRKDSHGYKMSEASSYNSRVYVSTYIQCKNKRKYTSIADEISHGLHRVYGLYGLERS